MAHGKSGGLFRTSIYLTPAQMNTLKGMDERSMAEHIRNAIDAYIEKSSESPIYPMATGKVEYKSNKKGNYEY